MGVLVFGALVFPLAGAASAQARPDDPLLTLAVELNAQPLLPPVSAAVNVPAPRLLLSLLGAPAPSQNRSVPEPTRLSTLAVSNPGPSQPASPRGGEAPLGQAPTSAPTTAPPPTTTTTLPPEPPPPQPPWPILMLVAAVVLFLLVQGRVDRRSPNLASAPLTEEAFRFS